MNIDTTLAEAVDTHTAEDTKSPPNIESSVSVYEQRIHTARLRQNELTKGISQQTEAETKAQIELLPEKTQQEIWQKLIKGEVFTFSHPLVKKLGLEKVFAECPADPQEKIRKAPSWKIWSQEQQTTEQEYVEKLKLALDTNIFSYPGLNILGQARQDHPDMNPYILYGKPPPLVRDRLVSLAQVGVLDLWNMAMLHEFIHVTRMRQKMKSQHSTLDEAHASEADYLSEDEANALLSDPAYQLYEHLPPENRLLNNLTDFVDKACYDKLSKETFGKALDTVIKLQALGLDAVQIAELIGAGKSLNAILASKIEETGIKEDDLPKAVEAYTLERNNARLEVVNHARMLITEAQALARVRTSIDTVSDTN